MLTRSESTHRYPATGTSSNISPLYMWVPSIITSSSKLDEVIKSVTVINESNKTFFEFMEEETYNDRITSEEIQQLKVAIIRIDENLSFVSIKQEVHEESIHQLTILVHEPLLPILHQLLNWASSMNKNEFSRSSDLEIKNKLGWFKTQVSNALKDENKTKTISSCNLFCSMFN
jgi:hypothetical protein